MDSPAVEEPEKASAAHKDARIMIVVSFVPHPSAIRASSTVLERLSLAGMGKEVLRRSPREAHRSRRVATASLCFQMSPVWK